MYRLNFLKNRKPGRIKMENWKQSFYIGRICWRKRHKKQQYFEENSQTIWSWKVFGLVLLEIILRQSLSIVELFLVSSHSVDPHLNENNFSITNFCQNSIESFIFHFFHTQTFLMFIWKLFRLNLHDCEYCDCCLVPACSLLLDAW